MKAAIATKSGYNDYLAVLNILEDTFQDLGVSKYDTYRAPIQQFAKKIADEIIETGNLLREETIVNIQQWLDINLPEDIISLHRTS